MLLLLGTLISSLIWPTNAQTLGKYFYYDTLRYFIYVDISEEKKINLMLLCFSAKVVEAGPYNLTATRGYQEYMIDYAGSHDSPSVLFDKIRMLCPDLHPLDSDLHTVTQTSGDTFSVTFEYKQLTLMRYAHRLVANTFRYTSERMNVHIIIDKDEKAKFTVECGKYTVEAEFLLVLNSVDHPYWVYDFTNEVGKESFKHFKERLSRKCRTPFHEKDFSYVVFATAKTLFSELHWQRIRFTAE
ncbi:hypothetical protein FOZ62_001191 [Perkinsus olseni]|uniref:Uncharacterized protein n=1 Tax=Perkinsus olseni TaxID=32597 RepID=A0A7J6QUH3_PEROL|nr:hypothetical protein FOZ62_001191 [Perkinsus olseni]